MNPGKQLELTAAVQGMVGRQYMGWLDARLAGNASEIPIGLI